jgi:hypothetical protein
MFDQSAQANSVTVPTGADLPGTAMENQCRGSTNS